MLQCTPSHCFSKGITSFVGTGTMRRPAVSSHHGATIPHWLCSDMVSLVSPCHIKISTHSYSKHVVKLKCTKLAHNYDCDCTYSFVGNSKFLFHYFCLFHYKECKFRRVPLDLLCNDYTMHHILCKNYCLNFSKLKSTKRLKFYHRY